MYHVSVCLSVIMSYAGIQRDDAIKDIVESLKAKHSSALEKASLQFPTIE